MRGLRVFRKGNLQEPLREVSDIVVSLQDYIYIYSPKKKETGFGPVFSYGNDGKKISVLNE